MEQLASALAHHYTIECEIGSGGMATVYLAEDVRHHRRVAVKVLRPELAIALGPDRFHREIEIAARLTHPHILTLIDSGDADGFLFFVMPYIEGDSLRDKLAREGELPIPEAVRILRDVVDALDHAHKQGVVHRDIKPDNVLLSERHALVTDFGVAKAVSEATGSHKLTTDGVALGTPAYMSPEQAAADSHIDHRADIYAVGALAYELLTGRPPFTGGTPQAVLSAQVTQTPDPVTKHRQTVSPALAQLVMKCLEKKPADRWQTAEELLSQLEALATPSGGVAPTVSGAAEGSEEKSIAILPFANMSADPENEYFSDGITEEVINAVARIPDLRVTARTSAFQFKGTKLDVREVGRKLSVESLLEGSVRRVGNRVRVTAQLVDAADGRHVWSERFDRDLEDVFAIQDEIAQGIAERLKGEFAPPSAREAAAGAAQETRFDPAAFDAFLRGRYHRRQMFAGGGAVEQAAAGYREAIEIDPEFALAYSALAELHIVLSIGFAKQPSRELLPRANEYAEQALALDPELPEAQLTRGLVAMYYEWDYAAAKAGIDRAIAINPSFVDAHFWAEFYYTYIERDFEQAVAANLRAAELDPLDLNIASRLCQVLIIFERLDEAIERVERIVRTDPNHMASYLMLADAYGRKGDGEKSMAAAERALELASGAVVAAIGMAIVMAARSGDEARARRLLQELTERAQASYVFPFWMAAAHAALGDLDRAFDYLAEAQRDRDPNLLYITAVPRSFGWRSDPRYGKLMREIGLAHLVE
jgi:TolB-like protein/tRNA A-37 threonylcarbamoyl transferase component Bud32